MSHQNIKYSTASQNKNQRKFYGLQTIDEKMNQLLKPIFQGSKREFILINNLVKNWSQIVGNKNAKFCAPHSINFEKNKSTAKLTIAVFNSAIGFFIENNSEIIIERIATLYGFKSISKIIIKQEPKNIDSSNNKNSENIKFILDEKINEKISQQLESIENKELSATLQKLAQEIFRK